MRFRFADPRRCIFFAITSLLFHFYFDLIMVMFDFHLALSSSVVINMGFFLRGTTTEKWSGADADDGKNVKKSTHGKSSKNIGLAGLTARASRDLTVNLLVQDGSRRAPMS
jgi:hypothetical protein